MTKTPETHEDLQNHWYEAPDGIPWEPETARCFCCFKFFKMKAIEIHRFKNGKTITICRKCNRKVFR